MLQRPLAAEAGAPGPSPGLQPSANACSFSTLGALDESSSPLPGSSQRLTSRFGCSRRGGLDFHFFHPWAPSAKAVSPTRLTACGSHHWVSSARARSAPHLALLLPLIPPLPSLAVLARLHQLQLLFPPPRQHQRQPWSIWETNPSRCMSNGRTFPSPILPPASQQPCLHRGRSSRRRWSTAFSSVQKSARYVKGCCNGHHLYSACAPLLRGARQDFRKLTAVSADCPSTAKPSRTGPPQDQAWLGGPHARHARTEDGGGNETETPARWRCHVGLLVERIRSPIPYADSDELAA